MYSQIILATLISAILFMLWCLRGVSIELRRRSVRRVEVAISGRRRIRPAEVVEIASIPRRKPLAAGLGKLAVLLVALVLFSGNGLARAKDPDANSYEILQLDNHANDVFKAHQKPLSPKEIARFGIFFEARLSI